MDNGRLRRLWLPGLEAARNGGTRNEANDGAAHFELLGMGN
jgi:hypothetical protein